jgi:hypothetical protein
MSHENPMSLSASSSLRALVKRWRGVGSNISGEDYYDGQRYAERKCADELSAALDASLESENANQGLREGSSQPVREPEATPNAGAIRALVQDLDFAIDATEPRDVILRRFADILERSPLWR